MQRNSLAQTAGLIGMAGAVAWLVSIFMQYGLGITGPASGALWVVHELLSFLGLIGAAVAFLGLRWGGAVRGRFGTIAVGVIALGYALIVIPGTVALVSADADSPLFLLFPIGGMLQVIGTILVFIATLTGGRWSGWQRWMPVVYAAYFILGMSLPLLFGITPDGPGMIASALWGVSWFLVALAVYTARSDAARQPAAALGQA